MRIGAFSFDSEVAFLSERLRPPVKIPKQEIIDDMLQSCGICLLRKVKTGIWIAGTVRMGQNNSWHFSFVIWNMLLCKLWSKLQLSLYFNMVDFFQIYSLSGARCVTKKHVKVSNQNDLLPMKVQSEILFLLFGR